MSSVLKLAALIGGLLMFICAVAADPQPGPPELTTTEIRQDLMFLRDAWAPKNLSFDFKQENEFQTIVAATLNKSKPLALNDLVFTVARAVAVGRNAHNSTAVFVKGAFPEFPIRVWWFSDGLYVTRAKGAGLPALGGRIIRIGALVPEEALKRVQPYIAGNTSWARYISGVWLIRPGVLREIGATSDPNEADLEFVDADGLRRLIHLVADPDQDDIDSEPVWSQALIPSVSAKGWHHVLEGQTVPPSLDARTDVAHEWLTPDTLYIRMNHVFSLDTSAYEGKLGEILFEAASRRPHVAIVDLRFNQGGDIDKALLFGQALPKLLSRDGKLIVLSGRATLSAAIVLETILKSEGRGKAVVVGEHVGDNSRFWSEGGQITLPHSGIEVPYNDKFWDLRYGCRGRAHCFWVDEVFGPTVRTLKPDIFIDWKYSDFRSGDDPALAIASSAARLHAVAEVRTQSGRELPRPQAK